MSGFTIKANVTVMVEMFIDAETKEEALDIFNECLAMSASLIDTKLPWDTYDDCITEISDRKAEAA